MALPPLGPRREPKFSSCLMNRPNQGRGEPAIAAREPQRDPAIVLTGKRAENVQVIGGDLDPWPEPPAPRAGWTASGAKGR